MATGEVSEGMPALSNQEIEEIVDGSFYSRYYGGCFTEYELANIRISENSHQSIGFFVLYTAPGLTFGHWVLLYFFKGHAIFADPFGAPPSEQILSFLKRVKEKRGHLPQLIVSDLDLQALPQRVVDFSAFICSFI